MQGFLQRLVKRAQGGQGQQAVAAVAVRCLCMLLTGLLHFNYASDLLQVSTRAPSHRDAADVMMHTCRAQEGDVWWSCTCDVGHCERPT